MVLNIEFDDKELTEILSNGIKNLSEETITELSKKAIENYLSSDAGIKKIFFTESSLDYYYRNYNNDRVLDIRPEIMKIILNSFSKEDISKYREAMFKVLDEQFPNLMISTVAQVFSNMLMTEDTKQKLSVELSTLAQHYVKV